MSQLTIHLPHPQPCVIRRAVAQDAPAIAALYRELVADPHINVLPEQVAALGDSAESYLLVVEQAHGGICGTALLTICADVMYGAQPFGVLENIVIGEKQRRQGFGEQLLAHLEQLAIARHCTKLMLLSAASREAAHAFFHSCGFNGDHKRGFVKYRREFATMVG